MAGENKPVQDFDALSDGIKSTDLAYIVSPDVASATGYYDYKATGASLLYQSLTYAAAAALATASGLVPGKVYAITDAVTSGPIYLKAATASTFFTQGMWAHTTNLKAFGSIIYSASSGSITNVVVNGVTITSGPIAYNTSLSNTITRLAANINAFQSTYTAYAIGGTLVIESNTAGTTPNGYVISSASTPTITKSITNMANGVASATRLISIEYDLTENQIFSAYDLLDNISYRMSNRGIALLGYNPILYFRWGDTSATVGISAWSDCVILDSDFRNCFAIGSQFFGAQFTGCTIDGTFFSSATADGAVWIDVDFGGGSFISTFFNKTQFTEVDFDDARMETVSFANCQFNNVDYFISQVVTNINMSGSSIQRNNFQLQLGLISSLNGTSGRGLVDVAIVLGIIPDNFFPDRSVFQSTGLTSSGSAELKAGIETDADDCMLPQTDIATLAAVPVVITQDPQMSTAVRNIVATPKIDTITGGSFRLWVSGKIGV